MAEDWLSLAFWTGDHESVRNLFLIIGGFLAGLGGFGLLWWRTWNIHRQTKTLMRRHEAQVEADRERRITDNFTRAVELLGSDKLETRLGAIYTLECIARESQTDHWPIMETLTAYVRERAPWPLLPPAPEKPGTLPFLAGLVAPERPATDVQAILTVLGRRHREHERNEQCLNLAGTDLRGADLPKAHLERIVLDGAHLERADLHRAYLEGASLFMTHLEGALLMKAHLRKAKVRCASFEGAHLEGADLSDTALTQEQIDLATTDEETIVPSHITRPAKPAGKRTEALHEVAAAQAHEVAAAQADETPYGPPR
jgi:hypothetical protein